MLAAVDLFFVLVATCVLAAVGLVVCLTGAVLEALRSDRAVPASGDRDGRAPTEHSGHPERTGHTGPLGPAETADPAPADRCHRPVHAEHDAETEDAVAEVAPPSVTGTDPAIGPDRQVDDDGALVPAALLPVSAAHRPSTPSAPAAPARVAAVEADRSTTAPDDDPSAHARRAVAVAAATAQARVPATDRRRREAPTSPVPVVRLTPYTSAAGQVRPTVAPRSAPMPVSAPAPTVAASDAAPTRPRRQPTATIAAPTARELAGSDVIDLDDERSRRTGQVPTVVVAATTTTTASDTVPAASLEASPAGQSDLPTPTLMPRSTAAGALVPAPLPAGDSPSSSELTATGPEGARRPRSGGEHDDELGRRRRRDRRAGRVHVEDTTSTGRKLPAGAEAALRSIIEVRPDPRNTLALQRDPTAEVRLTTAERAQAANAARRRPSTDDRRSA